MLPGSVSGEGGIRTPDAGIADVTVFETAAFNRSATSPLMSVSTLYRPSNRSPAATTTRISLRRTFGMLLSGVGWRVNFGTAW